MIAAQTRSRPTEGEFTMYYSIGQVAQLSGLPISTLRYYDKEGLFPALQRAGGIRQFTDRELETLHVIECLKRSGLEIRDIKRFMEWTAQGSASYPQRRALFAQQQQMVEAEIAKLQRVLAMLRFKNWYYTQAMQDDNEDAIRAMMPDRLPPEIQPLYDLAHAEE